MSTKIQTPLRPSFTPVPAGLLQRKCPCGQHTVAGSECEECRQKREGMLQRSAVTAAPVNGVPPIVHDVLNSPGQPLDAGTRAFMEPRFGYDFSQVRVHADVKAAESAQAVNALAYTVGRDVVFGEGEYEPGKSEGRRLLAHELTHVVQQNTNARPVSQTLSLGGMDDSAEQGLKTSASNATSVNDGPPIVPNLSYSPDRPLDASAQPFIESHFSHDFSRVHTDAPIIQTKLTVNKPGDICEQEADWVAEQVMRNSLRSALVPHISLLSSSYQSDVLNIQRLASVKKCSGEKKKKILEGIEDAKDLTNRALEELNREIPLSYVTQAIEKNFGSIGDDQKKTIISRYKNIKDTLDSKEIECKSSSKKKKGKDLCAEGRESSNEIFIRPPFGESVCPPGPVILHEAAHNANATADIDTDEGYPPKKAENNAYSYEHFALDVKKGPPKVELRPHKPTVPGE